MKKLFLPFLKILTQSFRVQQSFLNFFYRQYEASVFKNLIAAGHRTVLRGPFKGLKINATHSSRNIRTVHLLGMFETCLHDEVIRLIEKHEKVVNIGCGSGYYTNGIAHYIRQTDKNIVLQGYDICQSQIDAAQEIQKHNKLENVEHFCISPDHTYDSFRDQNMFVIVDIEGHEYPLLEQQKESFLHSDMLIEIHRTPDHSLDGGLEFLSSLYADTHHAKIIEESKQIDLSLLNEVEEAFGAIGYIGMHILSCENRSYPMKWLLLEKKK